MPGWLPVVRADDVLGACGLQVLAAPTEVRHLLRVARCKVGVAADVPGVGGSARVAAAQCIGDAAVVHGSGPATFTGRQELAVPAAGGHPHLEVDARVAGGLDDAGHTACRGIV